LVIFPEMILHFDVGRKRSKSAIDAAMSKEQEIFITAQKDPSVNTPALSDVYKIGTVCKITQIVNTKDDVIRVTIQGKSRAFITEVVADTPCIFAKIAEVPKSQPKNTVREAALVRATKSVFDKYIELSPNFSPEYIYKVSMCSDPSEIADYIAGNIILDFANKQMILEELDTEKRLELLIEVLSDELNIIEVENDIVEKARVRIEQNQREYLLREQLSVIQEELGEDDNPVSEAEQYAEKIQQLNLPQDVSEPLLKECSRLKKMSSGGQEANVVRNYLDIVLELPWNVYTKENINIKKARATLDSNHYGMDKVKDRIIEQLAVRQLNPEGNANIICLVGPPGVGKTSIAQSVAKAINRNCSRIALGGVRDEAEIRGHRKTYIGSMPGRIINSIKTAGSCNPLIILDEVDKLGNDYKGDPTSALLEVLDSEQNSKFVDHYIEVPFDLSKVMFITTANDLSSIPEPLRDRMDVIELPSYTREEKFNIAKKHLVKKQLEANGLTRDNFKISNKGIYAIIDSYTREAGVRNLERTIATLMRKSAVKILEDEEQVIKITDKNIGEYLGAVRYSDDFKSRTDEVGVVNGLAWTSVGGTLLPIEVAVMKGKGNLLLTGSLGDVMQESAKAAITCVRKNLDKYITNTDFYKDCDIHIHAPEGAVPKDGPSAGVTMATAIFSALTKKKVKSDVAMTGEITLRGRVMPIGGLREKSMAAYKNGIKTVIIPSENIKDLEEVDPVVKENVHFVPVKDITEVLETAIAGFTPNLHKSKKTSVSNHYTDVVRQ
ncbi:MAG: endopeptidase La, partial [Ruminococcus sp.]